jgi:Raf kinase inhibitor-like YbhB/YbcL family protein
MKPGLPSTPTMTLTSPAFADGEALPRSCTGDAGDVSPSLHWSTSPEGTKAFAVICRDTDAPSGTFIHWVIYNIPDTTRRLPPGIAGTGSPKDGFIQGKNDFGSIGYGGPKPPPGKVHRYFFDLYALDTMLPVEPDVDAARLKQLMNGHILATSELVGTYRR